MEDSKFCKDITDILVYINTRKDTLIRSLNNLGLEENIDYVRINEKKEKKIGRPSYTLYLTEKSYQQLLVYLHLNVRKKVSSLDNSVLSSMNYVKRYLPKETEILDFVYDTLSPIYNIRKQFKVLSYFIDLYFIDNKIAIECDELDHKYRDDAYEEKREQDISINLGCKFIRFNPDATDFKVSSLMTKILIELHP